MSPKKKYGWQQMYEKMLKFINCQGKQIKTTMTYLYTATRMSKIKWRTVTSADEDREQVELS